MRKTIIQKKKKKGKKGGQAKVLYVNVNPKEKKRGNNTEIENEGCNNKLIHSKKNLKRKKKKKAIKKSSLLCRDNFFFFSFSFWLDYLSTRVRELAFC